MSILQLNNVIKQLLNIKHENIRFKFCSEKNQTNNFKPELSMQISA